MTWKRIFDTFFAAVGLFLLCPLFGVVAILIKADSTGPIFFRQERMGQFGQPFKIYKFRTMVIDAERRGPLVSTEDDSRITRVGRFLRRTKIDELPQLINVLQGKMSIVGPRPEVPKYVAVYPEKYRDILRVRPGITDFASLEFKDENELLRGVENAEEVYLTDILPKKIELYEQYIEEQSIVTDLSLIFKTLYKIFRH